MNSKQKQRQIARITQVEKMLEHRELTAAEITVETGWSRATVWLYLLMLREGEQKRVYISSWDIGKTLMIERYKAGNLPDVVKPARPERSDEDEGEIKRVPAEVIVRRDPLVAALFGA
jgi:hypothetical protein